MVEENSYQALGTVQDLNAAAQMSLTKDSDVTSKDTDLVENFLVEVQEA